MSISQDSRKEGKLSKAHKSAASWKYGSDASSSSKPDISIIKQLGDALWGSSRNSQDHCADERVRGGREYVAQGVGLKFEARDQSSDPAPGRRASERLNRVEVV